MQCEKCRERDATIHLTRRENGRVQVVRLCSQCAASAPSQVTESVMKYRRKRLPADAKNLPKLLIDLLSHDGPRSGDEEP